MRPIFKINQRQKMDFGNVSESMTATDVNIKELVADIDEAVYDLFELTEDEREVVEEYLEVF